MKRHSREFCTSAEAVAFRDGIRFTNDSDVTAWIHPHEPTIVLIEDASYETETDDPWPQNLRNPDESGELPSMVSIATKGKQRKVRLPLQVTVEMWRGLCSETDVVDADGVAVPHELVIDDDDNAGNGDDSETEEQE